MPRKRGNPQKGDVFQFPLDHGKHGYGQVLASVVVGFYAIETDEKLALADIVKREVAFRAKCSRHTMRDGRWPIIGNIDPPPAMNAPMKLWRSTAPGFYFLYEWEGSKGGDERRVSEAEIAGLEENVITDIELVVARLKLFLRGEPWRWLTVKGVS
jgi:hypothetical protein